MLNNDVVDFESWASQSQKLRYIIYSVNIQFLPIHSSQIQCRKGYYQDSYARTR